ncbi:unnamed protein product [Eruca vesicaria subsp. sativa]|uniref:Uncharacterized protein n=1 Tax=Eruca vesicaria subsp. sativa TaxID=29727 RepID=A0ABC8JD77_ERUVS|nr:unnamed protein product [Eruca vesicaria subsp. sativa]
MSREHNRKLLLLQKATDKLNEAVRTIAESENYFLDMAATYGNMMASNLELSDVSWYVQKKERCLEIAKEFTDMRDVSLQELDKLHNLRTREIEAFQQKAALQKTRSPFCFFF